MPALQGWVATKLYLIQRDHLRCSLITSDSSSTCRPIILQHRDHSGSLTAFCFDYGHPCWCRANLALEEEVRKLQAAFWTQPLEPNTAVAVLLEVDQVYQQVFTPCCTTSTDHNISDSFFNCFLACSQLPPYVIIGHAFNAKHADSTRNYMILQSSWYLHYQCDGIKPVLRCCIIWINLIYRWFI